MPANRENAEHMVSTSLAFVGVLLLGLDADESAGQPGTKARTYYVDASQGADTHDGLAPANAWRSLARVNKATLQPGDRVFSAAVKPARADQATERQPGGRSFTGPMVKERSRCLLGSVAMDRPEDWQSGGAGPVGHGDPCHFERAAGSAPT